MRRLGRAIVIALLAMGGRASAATMTLDNFETPDPAELIFAGFTHPSGKPLQFSNPASTVGAQRDVKIDVDGVAKPNSAQVLIGYDENLYLRGILQVATASTPGSIVTLQYDGMDDNSESLTNAHGLNMVLAPEGGITIDFLTIDAPEVGLLDVAIRLFSNEAVATYHGQMAESLVATSMYAAFDEFDVGEGFSFSSVDSFEFVFNGSALVDVDFVVDNISATVPEPGTLVMAFLGIAGLVIARRRG